MSATCHAYYCIDQRDVHDYGTAEAVHEAMVIKCLAHYRVHVRQHDAVMGQMFGDQDLKAYRRPLFMRRGGQDLNMALRPGDHVIFARFETVFKTLPEVGRTIKLLTDRGVHVHVAGLTSDPSLWQFYIHWCCDLSHSIRCVPCRRTRAGLANARPASGQCILRTMTDLPKH